MDHYLFELCNHLSYVSMRSMIILFCLDTNIIICEEATVTLLVN